MVRMGFWVTFHTLIICLLPVTETGYGVQHYENRRRSSLMKTHRTFCVKRVHTPYPRYVGFGEAFSTLAALVRGKNTGEEEPQLGASL